LKKVFTIFILIIFAAGSFAQNDNEVIEITGRLLSAETEEPIRNANIINLKKKKVAASDTSGYFYFTLLRSDVLRISAVGYETEFVSFKDSTIFSAKIMTVFLHPKTYNIAEVDIYQARWDDFRFEFSRIEMVQKPGQERVQTWFLSLVDVEELKMITAANSVGIPIRFKTKREKQNIKVSELEAKEKLERIIEARFNRALTKEITGYSGEKLTNFMNFCNFSAAQVMLMNDYDVIMKIKRNKARYERTLRPGF